MQESSYVTQLLASNELICEILYFECAIVVDVSRKRSSTLMLMMTSFVSGVLLYTAFLILNISIVHSADPQCISTLIEWITSNGGEVSPSIEIKSNDIRNRGVYVSTTDSLKSSHKLASIPISLLFTLENAQKLLGSIIPQNKQDAFRLGPMDTLSFALIIEYQNEDSFWKPYLQCLPSMEQMKNELQMPLYWGPQIETYLQTSKIASFITRRLNSIQASFREIKTILQSISYMKDIVGISYVPNPSHLLFLLIDFTLDDWIWALSIVWSRSFSVMIEHQKMKVHSYKLCTMFL